MKTKQRICIFFATGFGCGYWRWGPGTAGAFVATLMWLACGTMVSGAVLSWITLCAIIAATLVGAWSTAEIEPIWGEDPKRVVIDEMLGVWIPLLVCPPKSLVWAALAFLLFRFFDICKPLGIRALDRRHGAFWVMADDILAGIYSLITILLIRLLL